MNERDYKELLALSWRRKLSPQEQEQLQEHLLQDAEARAVWEEEGALNEALDMLPAAPLSSNFTAQVLRALEVDEKKTSARRRGSAWLTSLLPRLGWAAAVGILAWGGVAYHKQNQRREWAESVTAVSAVAALAGPELLQDFEAIDRLRQISQVATDEELLDALQ